MTLLNRSGKSYDVICKNRIIPNKVPILIQLEMWSLLIAKLFLNAIFVKSVVRSLNMDGSKLWTWPIHFYPWYNFHVSSKLHFKLWSCCYKSSNFDNKFIDRYLFFIFPYYAILCVLIERWMSLLWYSKIDSLELNNYTNTIFYTKLARL